MVVVEKLRKIRDRIYSLRADNQKTQLIVGSVLARMARNASSIREAEFKVFSQFGDDGIIQFLISRVQPRVDTFIEFGVENYEESNTRFLLFNNNWKGLILDGSTTHMDYVRDSPFFWQYDLTATASFITAENINHLFTRAGITGPIGLLSIDIDGNDYWVWKAIDVVDADIVIVEYNSLFGPDRAITIPYQPDFVRTRAHYSNLYFGASLAALADLATEKGYAFVGCNQAGNNAYFVKNSKLNGLPAVSVADGFVAARFRESLGPAGELTLLDEPARIAAIRGLPVINVRTGQEEVL